MNVQFDDREAQTSAMYNQMQQSSNKGGLSGFLMKRGMSEKSANTTLIIVALIAIALAVYFFTTAS
ncbi:MAG: hypothetical protein V4697_01395 [Patescibacteria group bacterium]